MSGNILRNSELQNNLDLISLGNHSLNIKNFPKNSKKKSERHL